MLKPVEAIRLLLLTSALVSPSMLMAQDAAAEQAEQASAEAAPADTPADAAEPVEEDVDVSIPGGEEIVVRGYLDRNISKNAAQVVSVLSSADIERTGEGDIAGALSRVTGLSVVGSGFVYVRGLGDRYSLALLNGSPLPSPEPLKRVVPLDDLLDVLRKILELILIVIESSAAHSCCCCCCCVSVSMGASTSPPCAAINSSTTETGM